MSSLRSKTPLPFKRQYYFLAPKIFFTRKKSYQGYLQALFCIDLYTVKQIYKLKSCARHETVYFDMKKLMVSILMVMSAMGMKAQCCYGMDPSLAMMTMQAMSQVLQNPWSNVDFSNPTGSAYLPANMGTGCIVPMVHSDPCVNAAIRMAESDQRLMQQGVNVNYKPTSSRTTSSNHSHSGDWYECPCAKASTLGLESYHNCANCGALHMRGSHMCKRR